MKKKLFEPNNVYLLQNPIVHQHLEFARVKRQVTVQICTIETQSEVRKQKAKSRKQTLEGRKQTLEIPVVVDGLPYAVHFLLTIHASIVNC